MVSGFKNCVVCGRGFKARGRMICCSRECSVKRNIQKQAEWKTEHPRVFRKCPVCGKTFARVYSQVYCSPECKAVARRGYDERAKDRRFRASVAGAKIESRRAMMERLAERDAAYAAEFPNLASGAVRGSVCCGSRAKMTADQLEAIRRFR